MPTNITLTLFQNT